MIDWPALLAELARPFPAAALRYRVGAVSKDRRKAQALPYVEPRAYEARLDELAPGAWNVAFEPWGEGRLICRLTLHGVTRASTGESSDSPAAVAGTAAEAQAFKRACSKFGLGRYLYDIDIQWVDYDEEKRRLLQTPALPARYRPLAVAPAAPATTDPQVAGDGGDDHLSPERAGAMQRELEKLGVVRDEHRSFVAAVLGRRVRSLAELTEGEALEVWNAAKRSQPDLAF